MGRGACVPDHRGRDAGSACSCCSRSGHRSSRSATWSSRGCLADQAAVDARKPRTHRSRGPRPCPRGGDAPKEDFLSAAAHDLKTPLTTVVAQRRVPERRAIARTRRRWTSQASAHRSRVANASPALVADLLDATRLEQGRGLVGEREPVSRRRRSSRGGGADRDRPRRNTSRSRRGPWSACTIAGAWSSCQNHREREEVQPGGDADRSDLAGERGSPHDASRTWDRDPRRRPPAIFERFSRGSNVDDRRSMAGLRHSLHLPGHRRRARGRWAGQRARSERIDVPRRVPDRGRKETQLTMKSCGRVVPMPS